MKNLRTHSDQCFLTDYQLFIKNKVSEMVSECVRTGQKVVCVSDTFGHILTRKSAFFKIKMLIISVLTMCQTGQKILGVSGKFFGKLIFANVPIRAVKAVFDFLPRDFQKFMKQAFSAICAGTGRAWQVAGSDIAAANLRNIQLTKQNKL